MRARLADLHRIESALSRLVQECHTSGDNVCCPLIAALQHAQEGAAGAQG